MRKNFTIDQENAILCDGVLYDLHNCYSVDSILVCDNLVQLSFKPHSIHGEGLKPVEILAQHTIHAFIDQKHNLWFAEHVHRIGYADLNQHTLEFLLDEKHATHDSQLVFDFGVCTVRFSSEECKLIVSND